MPSSPFHAMLRSKSEKPDVIQPTYTVCNEFFFYCQPLIIPYENSRYMFTTSRTIAPPPPAQVKLKGKTMHRGIAQSVVAPQERARKDHVLTSGPTTGLTLNVIIVS